MTLKHFGGKKKNLGPRKSNSVPEKVYVNGILTDDITSVLQRWREDFYSLYNIRSESEHFNKNFFDFADARIQSLELEMNEPDFEMYDLLNLPISIQEIYYMIKKLKRNKAPGIDNIPYEILMNDNVVKILFILLFI
jgi:hypothetical protein